MAKPKDPSPKENIIGEVVFENRQKIIDHLNRGDDHDHSNIEKFQEEVCKKISDSKLFSSSKWETELSSTKRAEKDSIDIFGEDKEAIYIIEIDAARGDQVAKKFLSRIALWGLNPDKPITYIALLYPWTQKQGKPECEKFVRFSNDILKKINKDSSVIGIYIDCEKEIINGKKRWDYKGIELWDYNMLSGFVITDKNKNSSKYCLGMTECAKEAVKLFIQNCTPKDYDKLKAVFGRFVNNKVGKSRYAPLGVNLNYEPVHVYTQWREYGNQSLYWSEFVDICKQQGIIIERKIIKYEKTKFVTK